MINGETAVFARLNWAAIRDVVLRLKYIMIGLFRNPTVL